MEPRLHIDGTEEFGYSTVNRFLYSFYMYMNTVKRITNLYNQASVLNLKGYAAHFCYLRLKSFDTLIKVILEHKDYLSANCLLRMLGDSVSVFYLVYMEKDIELRWLRHALYVLEGCENNLKVLPIDGVNDGTMPAEKLKMHKESVKFNVEHRMRLIKEANSLINESPLRGQDKEAFDKIVKDRNWKFKEFKSYKTIKDNQYSWQDLYKMIGRCEHFDLLSYISQYVHSLSMSNLVMKMNQQNIDGVVGEALGLLKTLHNYTMELYKEEQGYILEGLLEPEMRDKILACFEEKHRPNVAKWENQVKKQITQLVKTGSFEIAF